MNKAEQLLSVFSRTVKVGGGIHTASELAFMQGEIYTAAFTKFLADCVKRGILRRVANGRLTVFPTPVGVFPTQ